MVSVCTAAAVPDACADRVGVPALVSLYWNVAVLLPLAIVTVVIGEPPGLLRKVPPDDDVPRFTVRPPTPALTAPPLTSKRPTVTGLNAVPAVVLNGVVLKHRWFA